MHPTKTSWWIDTLNRQLDEIDAAYTSIAGFAYPLFLLGHYTGYQAHITIGGTLIGIALSFLLNNKEKRSWKKKRPRK